MMSRTHDDCRSKTIALDGLFVSAEYEDLGIKNLIWQMKYNYVKEIAQVLSLILSDYFFLSNLSDYFSQGLVVPVPLHKRRERARGFNQSNLIAAEFARRSNLEYLPALERTRNSKTQIELPKKERFENVKNIFAAHFPAAALGAKKIILVDDVATTGATLNECAKILKTMKAAEVWGLVVARN